MRGPAALACAVAMLACRADDDACAGGDDALLELGQPTSGPFAPLADGTPLPIGDAPQGGFGVPVRVRTEGLRASNDSAVEVALDLELDGANAGHFELHAYPLLCESPEQGGTLGTVVVPLDPETYVDEDDLAPLADRTAALVVRVVDDTGRDAEARANVVLQLP